MYRFAMEALYEWKDSKYRKPLIIEGARQVGKTWLMEEFGKNAYKDYIYINFDANAAMESLFSKDLDINRIITGLELYAGKKIDPENTLLIFDEVQEVPKALSSLKYFYENAPQYHVMCAGSLLGIALHGGTSFPVGKVNFLKLYPLSFKEFLLATGMERFAKLLENKDFSMIHSFKELFIDALKHYYYVGGMPEAVLHFIENEDFTEVRNVQQRILDAYEQDFSKHAPNEIVPKIRMLWNSIPSQLAKENKKFLYGLVREGGRAKDYEAALMWLSDCGLVHRISRVTTPNLPLKAYEDIKAFKLFVLDVGLLGCMTGLNQRTLVEGNKLFIEFKGALTEQYVLQQLLTEERYNIYYYTNDRGSCEIDFVIDDGQFITPIEVKAEENLKAKSLRVYTEKHQPQIAVRTSMTDYREQDWMVNIPLYAMGELDNILSEYLKTEPESKNNLSLSEKIARAKEEINRIEDRD
ncbi:MAG: ATP-binding protein [Agathobacter sp.]